jgi:hypothetical protein
VPAADIGSAGTAEVGIAVAADIVGLADIAALADIEEAVDSEDIDSAQM